MERAIKAISENLGGVDELEVDYCNRCITSEFAPFEQLAVDFNREGFYSNEDLQSYLSKAAKKVRAYCIANPDTAPFFENLLESGVNVQKLTTFLWFCIDSGLQAEKNKQQLGVSIAAADLYIILCSVKSSKLYRLFSIHLLQKCIELFKSAEKLLRPLVSKVAGIAQSKKRGATDQERNDPLGIGDDSRDYAVLIREAMRSLFVVLHSHSIADEILENDQRCPMLVDFLRDVAYFDIGSSTDYNKRMLDSADQMTKASDLSFAIAHQVLDKSSELRALSISSRFVMPYLLFWICGSAKQTLSGTLPQFLKEARTVMVEFLAVRSECMTRVELDFYMKVLKTIPLKCFDRAEYRSNVADTLVKILKIVPPIAYFILDDIYVLGCHSKTSNRSFAYEIVSHLLRKFPFDQLPDPPIPYNALLPEENGVLNMEVVEDAPEVSEAELQEVADAIDDIPQEDENGDASNANEATENEVTENEPAENEPAENEATENEPAENENGDVEMPEQAEVPPPPPPFRAERSPDDLEFVRRGMNPKEAMFMLIINGLNDKFAKQKALQTVETLFTNDSCTEELCKMASKFVNENLEHLELTGRLAVVKDEPMDETSKENEEAVEVERPKSAEKSTTVYADDLLHLILKGFENDKTIICKHALSTCVCVLLRANVLDRRLFARCVEEIKQKTWDVAIQVRKQAAVCLKDLFEAASGDDHELIKDAWLTGLLHQVVDNEQTVAQQATKFVTEHIVNGLLNKKEPNPTWGLMRTVEENAEFTRYLAICLTEHTNNATSISGRGNNIQAMIDKLVRQLKLITQRPDCPPAAWMLLAELSRTIKVDVSGAEAAWDKLDLNKSEDRVPIYIARIIAQRCDSLKSEARKKLKERIGRQIMRNDIAIPHITAICYAFACLSKGIVPNGGDVDEEGRREMKAFIQKYNNRASKMLNETVFTRMRREIASRATNVATPSLSSQPMSELDSQVNATSPQVLMRAVYTVGELIQYAAGNIDSKIFNLLRGIVASNKIDADMQGESQASSADTEASSTVPRSVRAAAVLTLGKMSVVDESIAANVIPIFIRQLRQDPDHCVRNIILISMADICAIGNTAVNAQGDILASCMRDPSVLIRKHAVFLVSTLIRDEYFKWKGQVMYFFLGALLDPDKSVCDQVHASLLNVLLPKFPFMLSNNFIETMFYFNDVVHPSMAITVKQEEDECLLIREDRFNLFGMSRMEDRMKIYKFMVSTFEDTSNLNIMNQIANQIIDSIAEDILDISERNVLCLLLDAFKILRSKEIVLKMQTGKKPGGLDEIEEETEEAQQMQAAATDTIMNVYLRVMYQEVLVRLFKLRDYLLARGGQVCIDLAKNCHSTYLDICEHYLEYFDTLFYNDSQRRGEIRNDLIRIRKKNVPAEL